MIHMLSVKKRRLQAQVLWAPEMKLFREEEEKGPVVTVSSPQAVCRRYSPSTQSVS